MRAIPATLLFLSLAAAGAGLSACSDNVAFAEPRIYTDTVTIAVPSAGATLASAVDLVRERAPFTFLRRPELAEDAQQWDFALRLTEGGALALRPYTAPGSTLRGAGITLAAIDFDRMERAPRGVSPYVYQLTELTSGASYYLRSRQYGASGGFLCNRYGRVKVLALDPGAGTARLLVSVNENCDDERLTD